MKDGASIRRRRRTAAAFSLLLLLGVLFWAAGCPGRAVKPPEAGLGVKPVAPQVLGGTDPFSQSTPLLHDVTEQAGIAFKQSHGGCGLHYFPEQVAAGAAVFDADGDGNLDIYFPTPKPLGDCVGKTKGDFR